MNPALLFLVRRSFTNAILAKVKRLKNPRYLIPFAIGVAYFGMIGFGHFVFGDRPPGVVVPLREGAIESPDNSLFWEWGFAAMAILMAASSWFLPARGSPLAFLEPEVALLFPAPLTRKELVRYKILDLQRYLLVGPVLLCVLNLGRLGPLRALAVFAGMWLALQVLTLHGIGARMMRASLAEHGGSGLRRQAVPLLVLATFVGVVAFTAPRLPDLSLDDHALDRARTWLEELGRSPAGIALYPFRLIPRPAMARDLGGFLASGGILACLGVLLFAWVQSSDVAFEEAAAAQAENLTRRIEAARRGRFSSGETGKPPRRNPWRLGIAGSPEIAFVWKSVTETLRSVSPRILVFAVMALFISVLVAKDFAKENGTGGELPLLIPAASMVGFAVLLVVVGPSFLGVNLRQDLERVEALKCLPLTGARLVRSSLAGTVLPVAALQGLLVVLAVILFPAMPKAPEFTPAWRVAVAFVGGIGLPCITALSASVDAAGALFFPAWIKPGQPPVQGGMEGMGYGIVTTLAKAIVFGIGVVIPAGIGFLVGYLGLRFGGALLGPASAMAGALLAGALILGEVWIASRILGARFERLDPAEEGMIA